jgi:hypothetical protein
MDVEGDWWLVIGDAPPDRAVKLTLRDGAATACHPDGERVSGSYTADADRIVVTISAPAEPIYPHETVYYQVFVIHSAADARRMDEMYEGSFQAGNPLPALDDESADWVSEHMVAYRSDPAGQPLEDWDQLRR